MIIAWKNHSVLGARYFLLTLTLVEIWIVAQGFEMAALDLSTKIIWANLQYFPIMLTPVAYLYLTLQFTGHENWLHLPWLLLLLLVVPLTNNIMVWTNDMHGLIRQNIYLDFSVPFPTVGKTYGPVFWLFALYNYSIVILTMVHLANAFKERMALYRKQIISLVIALLLPLLANALYVVGLSPFKIDITPPCFGISALIISWGIFRYRLFDVIPIAHSIIIQEMRTGMIVLDNEGRFLDINPAARKMLNLPSGHLIGHFVETELSALPDLIRIYQEGKNAIYEVAFENSGTFACYEISFMQIKNRDKNATGWLLQIYDITERKFAEEIIQYAALHDDLTGLPNRNYFQILFSQELAYAKVRGDWLVVAFLDLDNFKMINDRYGHDVGDRVLCKVAERLQGALYKSDIISRMGGDEFIIVLPHVDKDADIANIGNKILAIFEKDYDFDEGSLRIQASIGFSVFPRDGDNIEVLLKKADKAMYTVKGGVKNDYCIYQE